MSIVIGIDGGLANMGWAVVELHPTYEKIIALGTFSTDKSDKKSKVLAADDNFRRARELSKELHALFNKYKPAAVCMEAQSFPRSSSAAAKTAMSLGILASIVDVMGIPVCMCSPQQLKKFTTGKIKSEKEEVQAFIHTRYGEASLKSAGIDHIKNAKKEHPYDALAAICTCLDSDIIMLLRNMNTGEK